MHVPDELLRDGARAAREAPARPVDLNRLLELREIDALVLKERIVFRDEDGAFQIGRHVRVAHPSLHAAGHVAFRAGLVGANPDERRRRGIASDERPDVRQREVDVDQAAEAGGSDARDDLKQPPNHRQRS